MKMIKFKNIGIILVLILGIFSSCEDDGGSSEIPLNDGVVPNVQKVADSPTFINLIDLQAGQEIVIDFDVDIAQGSAAKTDVVAFYSIANPEEGETGVLQEVLFEDINLPEVFTVTTTELVAAFDGLDSVDDFQLGDVLSITTRHTKNDGTVLNIYNDDGTPNVGSNILTVPLFNVATTYLVSCPSDLGGSYTFTGSDGVSTDAASGADQKFITSDYTYDVEIVDDGGGSYTVTDAAFGVYIYWYTTYGLTFEFDGTMVDVCDTISGAFTSPFGEGVTYEGEVNEDGSINIRLDNDFGDFIEGVLTPN